MKILAYIPSSKIKSQYEVPFSQARFLAPMIRAVECPYRDTTMHLDIPESYDYRKCIFKNADSEPCTKSREERVITCPKEIDLPFCNVIYSNSLWRQYHTGHKTFAMSFTNTLPEQTRKQLEKLNLSLLRKIFACAKTLIFLPLLI